MINPLGPDNESVPLPVPKALKKSYNASKTIIAKIFKTFKRGGAAKKDRDNPLGNVYNYLGNRPFWGYHAFFTVLVIIIGTGNALAKSKMEHDILFNPSVFAVETKANFAASVENLTPVVQEDPATMVLTESIEETSGYYSQPLLAETKTTERPKPVEATEDLQNRSKSITYTVKEGDTLGNIGWKYGLKVATIRYQNDLKGETITPGQKLTLPPGDINASVIAKANQKKSVAIADSRVSSSNTVPSSGGYSKPTNWQYISRRLGGGHTGTDMVAPTGTPVYAAMSGVVTGATGGWNGGYGNIITIDHGNGVKTRYAHLSSIGVSAGQTVSAGQYIGAVGSTGRSTGSHLHFEAIKQVEKGEKGGFMAPF